MNQTATALIVGLLAGAAGAVVVGFVSGSGTPAPVAGTTTDLSGVVERLERIEAALDQDAPLSPGALRGSGAAERAAAAKAADARLDKLVAKLEARLAPVVKETVDNSIKAAIEEAGPGLGLSEIEVPARKEVTLAQAAQELGLTREEEDAVRRIAKETSDGIFNLLVDENTTIDDVRREFEEAKANPAKKIEVATKYMGKAMQNLGGFMGVMMSHETKMRNAIGAEKKRKLERDYKVTDLDPYGIEDLLEFD